MGRARQLMAQTGMVEFGPAKERAGRRVGVHTKWRVVPLPYLDPGLFKIDLVSSRKGQSIQTESDEH